MKIRYADARQGIPTFCNSLKIIHKLSGKPLDDVIAANADEGWIERYEQNDRPGVNVERIECAIEIHVDEKDPFGPMSHGKQHSDIEACVFYDEDLKPRELAYLQRFRADGPSVSDEADEPPKTKDHWSVAGGIRPIEFAIRKAKETLAVPMTSGRLLTDKMSALEARIDALERAMLERFNTVPKAIYPLTCSTPAAVSATEINSSVIESVLKGTKI